MKLQKYPTLRYVKWISLILLLFVVTVTLPAQDFADKNIPQAPALFLENDVSTSRAERDMAIAPDGSEMFYTMQGNQNLFSVILHRQLKKDKTWSSPEVASFSGRYSDLEPFFSADGKKLFFSSARPLLSGDKAKDYDIWYVEKVNGKWLEPKNIGTPVNTPANEFYPSVANNGNLYFTSEYDKGIGKEDIYVSRWVNNAYTESVPLDTAVNSAVWEFNAFVSPDEQLILFTSYGRKEGPGGGDLYISRKGPDGKWQPAKNVTLLNSPKLDYCPFVSPDKKILFFTSNRHTIPASFDKAVDYNGFLKMYSGALNGLDNIYWVSLQKVLEEVQ